MSAGHPGEDGTERAAAQAYDEIVITHETGLHARPAIKLTKLAKSFKAGITVRQLPDGEPVDAKSIVKVMALKLPKGTTIGIDAIGPDALEAVAALIGLIERDFSDE